MMKPPRLAIKLLGAYVLLFALANAVPGGLGGWGPFERPVVAVVQVTAALVTLARAALVRDEERLPWLCLGAGALSWAGGDVYWLVVLDHGGALPVPSPADVGYLAFIPFATAGLLLLARQRTGRPMRGQF